MKYYKLTCIKDMPECEKGFSVTVSEESLKENRGAVIYSHDPVKNDKIHALIYHKDNKDFVEVSIDLNKAYTEIKCPHCNKESLFLYESEEYSKYSGDVTYWYIDTGLECGICGFKKKLSSINTRHKVHW